MKDKIEEKVCPKIVYSVYIYWYRYNVYISKIIKEKDGSD